MRLHYSCIEHTCIYYQPKIRGEGVLNKGRCTCDILVGEFLTDRVYNSKYLVNFHPITFNDIS